MAHLQLAQNGPRSLVTDFPEKKTLLGDRHHNLTLPSGESRVMRAERGISLPVAGAPTLPSESDVENDVTFGGRVSCDRKHGGDQREVSKRIRNLESVGDPFSSVGHGCPRFAACCFRIAVNDVEPTQSTFAIHHQRRRGTRASRQFPHGLGWRTAFAFDGPTF